MNKILKRVISFVLAFLFAFETLCPCSNGYAQTLSVVPSASVTLSPAFIPPHITGMTIYPDNPFQFDFIVDAGDDKLQGKALHKESMKLVRYFLAALTVPDKEMWVNLAPGEQHRIIAPGLAQTEMGADMLALDFILKQLTASLLSPENEWGKKFWEEIYTKANKQFGLNEISQDVLSRIWIVPERASMYVHEKSVFVVDAHLKVMMEGEYESGKWSVVSGKRVDKNDSSLLTTYHLPLTTQIMNQILLPAIEHEINTGRNFAQLRQIFYSMILATWYKQNLKTSLLNQTFADQNKVKGIDFADKNTADDIYQKYLQAFKNGTQELIKEEYDPQAQEIVIRKYMTGGNDFAQIAGTLQAASKDALKTFDAAQSVRRHERIVVNVGGDAAMTGEAKSNKEIQGDTLLTEAVEEKYMKEVYPETEIAFSKLSPKMQQFLSTVGLSDDLLALPIDRQQLFNNDLPEMIDYVGLPFVKSHWLDILKMTKHTNHPDSFLAFYLGNFKQKFGVKFVEIHWKDIVHLAVKSEYGGAFLDVLTAFKRLIIVDGDDVATRKNLMKYGLGLIKLGKSAGESERDMYADVIPEFVRSFPNEFISQHWHGLVTVALKVKDRSYSKEEKEEIVKFFEDTLPDMRHSLGMPFLRQHFGGLVKAADFVNGEDINKLLGKTLVVLCERFGREFFTAHFRDFMKLAKAADLRYGRSFDEYFDDSDHFGIEHFKQHWKDIVRMGLVAKREMYELFRSSFASIGIYYEEDFRQHRWDDFVRMGLASQENIAKLFEHGVLGYFKYDMGENLIDEYWDDIVESIVKAGRGGYFLIKILPHFKDLIEVAGDRKQTQENLRLMVEDWTVYAQEDQDFWKAFRTGINIFADFIIEKDDLESTRKNVDRYRSRLSKIYQNGGFRDSFMKEKFEEFRKSYGDKFIQEHFEDVLEIFIDAGENTWRMFYNLNLMKEELGPEFLTEHWNVIVSLTQKYKDQTADIIKYGLFAFKNVIFIDNNKERQIQRLYTIAEGVSQILVTQERLNFSTSENPFQKLAASFPADFLMAHWNDIVSMALRAGEDSIDFISIVLPRMKRLGMPFLKKHWRNIVELAETLDGDMSELLPKVLYAMKYVFGEKELSDQQWGNIFGELIVLVQQTNVHNREDVADIIFENAYLKVLKEKNASFIVHLKFYTEIIKQSHNLGLLNLENVVNGIKKGFINASLEKKDREIILELITKINVFNPLIFQLYKKKGDEALKPLYAFASSALTDDIGEDDIDQFLQLPDYESFSEEQKLEILSVAIQITIPSSGSSFIDRGEVLGLLKNMIKMGDQRDHIPSSLRGILGEGAVIPIHKWIVKEGESIDPQGQLLDTVKSLQQSNLTAEKHQELEEAARLDLENKIQDWFKHYEDLVKKEKALKAFYQFVKFNPLIHQKIGAIYALDYLGLLSLRTLYTDQDNLRKYLAEVLESISMDEFPQKQIKKTKPVERPEIITENLEAIWKNGKIIEEKKKIIRNYILNYSSGGVKEKILDRLADPDLKLFIESLISNGIDTKVSTVNAITAELIQDPLMMIEKEIDKFQYVKAADTVPLEFRMVKGIAHGLWGLNCGVCTGGDLELWRDKRFLIMPMIDRRTNKVRGYIEFFESVIDAEKVLTVVGIDPNLEFVSEIRVEDLYSVVEKVLLEIKDRGGYLHVYLPKDKNIISNIDDLADLVFERHAKEEAITLKEKIVWNRNEEQAEPIQEVWEVRSSLDRDESQRKDGAMAVNKEEASLNPGGIDFNPTQMKMDAQGDQIQMTPQNSSPSLIGEQGLPVQFNPVIINVIPIPDFSLLLGLSEKKEEEKFLSKI